MIILTCSNSLCNKEIKRKQSEINRSKTGKFYCSSKCSAIINNKLYPKRKRLGCRKCGIDISELPKTSRMCKDCNPSFVDWNSITLKEVIEARGYQKHSRIRTLSRKTYLMSNKPKYCMAKGCNYSLHFDVCHIKDIQQHDNSSTIGEINSLDNLIALCKNHHWEFDNGHLDIKDILL